MIQLIWYKDGMNNWGDYLPPVMVKYITGEDSACIARSDTSPGDRYSMIGSIMEELRSPNTIIWGTGFMWENGKIPARPKKICAVRGPLSRLNFIKQGISCPEIYGDPALLFPKFYNPDIKKKYKLGIIPHYVDKTHEWVKAIRAVDDPNILILDICSETHEFVNDLKSCDKVISSSLHGLIAADAYGIPSMWVQLTDKVGGRGFKFRDYFMSVNREDRTPYMITKASKIEDVYKAIPNYKISIDLDLLYNVCPFKK